MTFTSILSAKIKSKRTLMPVVPLDANIFITTVKTSVSFGRSFWIITFGDDSENIVHHLPGALEIPWLVNHLL